MPIPLGLAIAGTALSAGSGALNFFGQKRAQKQQRAHEFELQKYAYKKDLEMWNRMNEYNSPSAQVERFREAGLNPHFALSKGTPGNSATMPKYQAPKAEYYMPEADFLMGHLSNYLDLKTKYWHSEDAREQTQFRANTKAYWFQKAMEQSTRTFQAQQLRDHHIDYKKALYDKADKDLLRAGHQAGIAEKQLQWMTHKLNAYEFDGINIDKDRPELRILNKLLMQIVNKYGSVIPGLK